MKMLIAAAMLLAAQDQPGPRPEDTEVWKPEPPVVTVGAYAATPPPSDAVVLFDGRDLSQWAAVKDGAPARWVVSDGVVTVAKGTGNIQTRRRFGSYQLHIEWRIPAGITGEGQKRGNSGVFLASTGDGDAGYELQILDSYRNSTYVNGQAGSIYKQFAPLANPMRPPGEWQSYDIAWTAPIFDAAGRVTRPAMVTVMLNGVLVQNNTVLKGPTQYIGQPSYKPHGPAPIKLQDHGDPSAPISFRNIWLRELK
ncbi:3-keto-disaccharide hydrolase [Sphingomonas sp.]|uniref:3-keto-disaccharide hydrolase n=1 Tax=Sphingomonas sp. TaxID=28214 RepID=UPI003D6CE730